MSNSVANALRLTGGEDAAATAEFVEYFDKFFDCVNVGDFTSGKRSRNSFKDPYRSGSDFRLKVGHMHVQVHPYFTFEFLCMVVHKHDITPHIMQWLSEDFLGYLSRWEQSVRRREGFTPKQKRLMLLSPETILGLRITGRAPNFIHGIVVETHFINLSRFFHFTVHSFVELTHYLFTIPGVKAFLSRRLSQDPLEQFFGCVRQRGGVHDNPNAVQFLKNTQVLRVVNTCKPVARGNCRGNTSEATEQENMPLPRRKKRRSKPY